MRDSIYDGRPQQAGEERGVVRRYNETVIDIYCSVYGSARENPAEPRRKLRQRLQMMRSGLWSRIFEDPERLPESEDFHQLQGASLALERIIQPSLTLMEQADEEALELLSGIYTLYLAHSLGQYFIEDPGLQEYWNDYGRIMQTLASLDPEPYRQLFWEPDQQIGILPFVALYKGRLGKYHYSNDPRGELRVKDIVFVNALQSVITELLPRLRKQLLYEELHSDVRQTLETLNERLALTCQALLPPLPKTEEVPSVGEEGKKKGMGKNGARRRALVQDFLDGNQPAASEMDTLAEAFGKGGITQQQESEDTNRILLPPPPHMSCYERLRKQIERILRL